MLNRLRHLPINGPRKYIFNCTAMPDYREIYNQVVTTDERYNLAQNSPGFRSVVQATNQLQMLSGRALDVGCGVGFVLEYLAGPSFDFNVFGVDASNEAITKARTRMQHLTGADKRLLEQKDQRLPFDDDWFSLVTCFDVLEHLDLVDIEAFLAEFKRVLRPRGLFFGSVSCRNSKVTDLNGENLHRTVKSPDWWIEKMGPDRAEYDGVREQLTLWKYAAR